MQLSPMKRRAKISPSPLVYAEPHKKLLPMAGVVSLFHSPRFAVLFRDVTCFLQELRTVLLALRSRKDTKTGQLSPWQL